MRPERYQVTSPIVDRWHGPWSRRFGSLAAALSYVRRQRKWNGYEGVTFEVTDLRSHKSWRLAPGQ